MVCTLDGESSVSFKVISHLWPGHRQGLDIVLVSVVGPRGGTAPAGAVPCMRGSIPKTHWLGTRTPQACGFCL